MENDVQLMLVMGFTKSTQSLGGTDDLAVGSKGRR